MKKIGKKLSYFTKVLLVLGLLFSNLSGLSVVFAYEAADNFTVMLSEDNKLVIDYQKELDETDIVKVEIGENYTYLENVASETQAPVSYEVLGSELLVETGLVYDSSILSSILFDGLYEGKVSLYNVTDDMDLGTVLVSKDMIHNSGLEVKVYDNLDNELSMSEDEIYNVTSDIDSVYATMKILAGGLKPTDIFVYDEVTYTAEDILSQSFTSEEIKLVGRLYGEYTEEVSVSLLLNDEETVISDELAIVYGTYEENADVLNAEIVNLGLGDMYGFASDSPEGQLYVMLQDGNQATMLDLYNILVNATGNSEIIKFVISNNEYEDLLKAYEELAVAPLGEGLDTEVPTLEEFLKEILVDDSTVVTLVSEDLIVSYVAVVVADLNNDSVLNEEDLLLMINQVIGMDEVLLNKADIYGTDGKVNVSDVMYLSQIIKNKTWEQELINTELETINTRLDVVETDIVSGDEVTVKYVLTVDEYDVNGIAGIIDYDETMLELVSVEVNEKFIGNNHEGNFLYLSEESLSGNTVVVEEQEAVEPVEYVLLTLTFKTLKSGVSSVSIENPEYFNQNEYYKVENTISTLVIVNESNDSTLSSLVVSGQTIELLPDVLEYKITVSNDVVSSVVDAVVSNVAASITSIIAPEELVEGENTISVVVTAENGDESVYTIIVVREESVEEEEEETTGTVLNYTNNDVVENTPDNESEEEDLIVGTEEEEPIVEEKEEDDKLSRIIIIILILFVIAGLIYLIFKDDNNDNETKHVNKEINKLKKDNDFNVENKKTDKVRNKSKNNKKGR